MRLIVLRRECPAWTKLIKHERQNKGHDQSNNAGTRSWLRSSLRCFTDRKELQAGSQAVFPSRICFHKRILRQRDMQSAEKSRHDLHIPKVHSIQQEHIENAEHNRFCGKNKKASFGTFSAQNKKRMDESMDKLPFNKTGKVRISKDISGKTAMGYLSGNHRNAPPVRKAHTQMRMKGFSGQHLSQSANSGLSAARGF